MADAGPRLQITIAYSPGPREVRQWDLQVATGTTVREALMQSGLFEAYPDLRGQSLSLAVWGRAATPSQSLRERDRIEVLRPLRVDPKVARRERFARQGTRAAGLFARKPGKRRGPGTAG